MGNAVKIASQQQHIIDDFPKGHCSMMRFTNGCLSKRCFFKGRFSMGDFPKKHYPMEVWHQSLFPERHCALVNSSVDE
jgi:hypothetical protein